MAHQTMAVQSMSSAQATSDPGSTLIGYYENCMVMVDDLDMEIGTLGDQLKISTGFSFSGIDENCPELTATVWVEPPAQCATNSLCPAEGFEVVIAPEDVKNGAWSHDFTLNAVSGDWYAHVTVSPYGFECAMAITDACTMGEVDMPCNAAVTSWVGTPANNPDVTDDSYVDADGHYYGPYGTVHSLNWGITGLWNCNKCATLYVSDESGTATDSYALDYDTLAQYSGQSGIATQMWTYSSYESWTYTLSMYDCDSDPTDPSTPPDDTVFGPVDSWAPACEVSCEVDITSVTNSAAYPVIIAQTVGMDQVYTCKKLFPNGFSANLTHDDYFSEAIAWAESQNVTDNIDNGVYSLNWDNFPVAVNSAVNVYSAAGDAMGTCTDTFNYWPDCTASAFAPTLTAVIDQGLTEEDLAFNTHKIALTTDISASIGAFCPGFTGVISLFHNDAKQQSWDLGEETMEPFFGSGVVQTYDHTVDFDDGSWCVEFSMTAVDSKANSSPVTSTSTRTCAQVEALPCELEAATFFDGSLSATQAVMTYTAGSSFTKNSWCNLDDLSY